VRVLALDAATEMCSVALLLNGDVIVRSIEAGKSSAQQLLSLIEEVMAEGQVSLSSLDGLAASIGPGAFTGVRITVAVAQGLAFGAGLRVAPVTTLEALALQAFAPHALAPHALDTSGSVAASPGPVIACLDARMGEVYWGCFTADAARGVIASSAPQVGPPATVALGLNGRHLGIGRGFSAYPELAGLQGIEIGAQEHLALPNAREIVRLGALRLAGGGGLDPADLQPLYLRDKVALTEAERAAQSR
jgi:tRNA threonylcarbamoyladenosine biosynthesis protein TsaB